MISLEHGWRHLVAWAGVAVRSAPEQRQESRANPVDAQAAALLRLEGCPASNDLAQFEHGHFFWLLNESYQEMSVLQHMERALGFCPAHGAYLARSAESVSSVAYIHGFVIRYVSHQIEEASQRKDAKRREEGLFRPTPCYTCKSRNEQAERTGFFLASLLLHPREQAHYGMPGVLCLPHLTAVASRLPLPILDAVISVHKESLATVREALLTNRNELHDNQGSFRSITPNGRARFEAGPIANRNPLRRGGQRRSGCRSTAAGESM